MSVSISCLTWSWAEPRARGAVAIEPPVWTMKTEAAERSSIVTTIGWTKRSDGKGRGLPAARQELCGSLM